MGSVLGKPVVVSLGYSPYVLALADPDKILPMSAGYQKHRISPPGGMITCVTEMVEGNIVVGIDDGRVYVFDTKSIEFTFLFALRGCVSTYGIGKVVLWGAHDDNRLIAIDIGKKTATVLPAKILEPLNASYQLSDDLWLVVSSVSYDHEHDGRSHNEPLVYARMLTSWDTQLSELTGSYACDESNEGIYCEYLDRYDGKSTDYFKEGCMYAQFRTWDKSRGFIHKLGPETCENTAYRLSCHQNDDPQPVPLIFAFVPNSTNLISVWNNHVVTLVSHETDKVLCSWSFDHFLLPHVMPSVTVSTTHAFVRSGNSLSDTYVLRLFPEQPDGLDTDDLYPHRSNAHVCAVTREGRNQLVLLAPAAT